MNNCSFINNANVKLREVITRIFLNLRKNITTSAYIEESELQLFSMKRDVVITKNTDDK